MWLMSPLSWLLLAVLGGWVSTRLPRGRRAASMASVALALAAVVAMTPLFANGLLGRLEKARPASTHCSDDPPDVAVVLAGGVSGRAASAGDLSVLGLASRRRLDRAVAWWRAGEGRRLVMSGGSWFGDGIPDSTLMLGYARRLGVPPSAVLVEDASLTTWESAQRLARLRPRLPERIALVTSAAHMPRAAYAMQQAGFEVCPVAADRRHVPLGLPGYLIPQRSALEKTESGLHEVVGLLYYRWLAYVEK